MAEDQAEQTVTESVTLHKYDGDPEDGKLVEVVTITNGSVSVEKDGEVTSYADLESYEAAQSDGS